MKKLVALLTSFLNCSWYLIAILLIHINGGDRMQQFISALMIFVYTIYFGIYVKLKKPKISDASGKCISMSLGMVSSTMIGLILALILRGELAYSTILSIVTSCILAYFIGKSFGISGIIEGMAASFMGAMMGAMLGVMIPAKRETFMMISMDLMYLVTITSLLFMINKEAGSEKHMKATILAPLFLSFLLFISMISLVAMLEAGIRETNKNSETEVEHSHYIK